MKYLTIDELPPSMKGEAYMIRPQILDQLAQSQQQREQQEQLRRKLELKMKRRIRKAQNRGRKH